MGKRGRPRKHSDEAIAIVFEEIKKKTPSIKFSAAMSELRARKMSCAPARAREIYERSESIAKNVSILS